jgi:tRNA-specific 2-thiouridylase
VADKPDSHDVCFVPTGDTPSFLSKQLGAAAGDIVEAATGKLLGQHAGAFRYTVGQRRGLGLQRAGPDGARRYVLRVLPECNTVLVGPRERLAVRSIRAGSPVWHRPRPAGPLRCEAQLRAHGEPLPATARQLGDQVCVEFDEPAFGVAAGQTVALYRGDRVVAGGTIVATG